MQRSEAKSAVLLILSRISESESSGAEGLSGAGTLPELLQSAWGALGGADEADASALLKAFASLAPEDFVRLLEAASPEQLVRNAADHRLPAVRGLALQTVGAALVRAWPCVTAGQNEHLRDAVVEAFRSIFGRLSSDECPVELKAAAAAVLDALLAAHLATEPRAFAPIALLHVGWHFASIYATLLVELSHDLLPVLPRLYAAQDSARLVLRSCVWIPGLDTASAPSGAGQQSRGEVEADWPALASESAAFRGALVWILLHCGGLGRRDSEDGQPQRRCGSLIYDLVQEVVGGPQQNSEIPGQSAIEVPADLQAALRRASEAAGQGTGARFARCRASLMLAVVELARGAVGPGRPEASEEEPVLRAAEAMAQACQGATHPLLQHFLVESMCSLVFLWPLLYPRTLGAPLDRFTRLAAGSLVLGVRVAPPTVTAAVPRVVRLLALLASALVQALARAGAVPDLQALFAKELGSSAGGAGGLPPLLVALLCCGCLAQLRAEPSGPGGLSVADAVVTWSCQRGALAEAGRTSGSQQGAAAAAAGCWNAALWLLLAVAKLLASSGEGAIAALAEGLATPELLAADPAATTMLAAAMWDFDALGRVPAGTREKVAQALRASGSSEPQEIARYVDLVVQAVRSPQQRQPSLGAHLGGTGVCLQSVLWLHSLSQGSPESTGSDAIGEPSVSLSGPPLMIYARFIPKWPRPGVCHVVLRIDIYNVTGLTYRNVTVGLSVSRSCAVGASGRSAANRSGRGQEPACSWAEGLGRPCDRTIDTMPCRTSATVWRDLRLRALAPVSLTVRLGYENIAPEGATSPATAGATPGGGGGGDAWSDDEEPEQLQFACHPCALPLSVFFRPFHGFDDPAGSAFPPPMLFLACPHVRAVSVAELALDPEAWRPPGFRRLAAPAGCRQTSAGAMACFAGVALDEQSLLCLICRGTESGGCQSLEVRSNSEALLGEFLEHLAFWVLSSAT
mmetsp:Transcript_6704/g.25138  ORF Transcript_6704/g.25138 Transcript_6704/m.25138 type:complete len:971 (-) Transcript_6704:20-2932(-)